MRIALSFVALAGCGGDWVVTIWGEEYIEEGIPSTAFADGCEVTFSRFHVALGDAALLDGDGEVVAAPTVTTVWDVAAPGPQEVARFRARATTYDTVRFEVSQEDPSQSVMGVDATLTCGADTVTFSWNFETHTTYLCEPDLTIPSGGEATTEFTVHGDHLFYDGLEDPDAEVRGQAIVDADGDGDGVIGLHELDAVPVAPLGYSVGQYSDVVTLLDFVTHLTRTVGHVDGEGHCQVDL